jgi:dihydrofolate reductase
MMECGDEETTRLRPLAIEGPSIQKESEVRKLKIIEHISLDGVIQAGSDNEGGFSYGDWSVPYRSPAGLKLVLAEYGERFDVLLGRRTYDLWSEFWPTAPQSPMADRLRAAKKYVVTHRPESLKWGPCEGVGPDLVNSVHCLKAMDGPALILSGSSTLTSTIIEHGLADEVILLVNPVFLGKGKRLFSEGTPARALELVSSQALATGILVNAYKPAGTLRNLR